MFRNKIATSNVVQSGFKKMNKTLDLLSIRPVIAAVRTEAEVDEATKGPSAVIFMMGGDLIGAQKITEKVLEEGKQLFHHIELVGGLGRDKEAVEYTAKEIKPTGIVSTKPQLLKIAQRLDLLTVLQIFTIDSQAFESGVASISSLEPDMIEIMPGLMPRIAAQVKSHFDIPLIAAGLVKQEHEVDMMLRSGCHGVAVSEQSLWGYTPA